MSITHGTKVRHRRDRALGLGEVGFVETIAGIEKVWVRWPSKPNTLDPHTAGELEVLLPLVDRLSPNAVGPASFIPFSLARRWRGRRPRG